MLSDRDRRSLNDIVWNIDLAVSFVQVLAIESFAADLRSIALPRMVLPAFRSASGAPP